MLSRDNIGWLASILLMFCSVPQAVQSIENGHSIGVNKGMLVMWFLGTLGMLYLLFPEKKEVKQVYCSYAVNCIAAGIILFFKLIGG